MLTCRVRSSITMKRWIDAFAYPGLRVAGDDHAGVEVRPAVPERVHRSGDAPQVHLHGLAFVDRSVLDHHRRVGPALPLLDAPGDVLGEGMLVALHQRREQFPGPVQADQHRRAVSLDVLEEHRAGSALEAGRDARQLQVRIDFRAHPKRPIASRSSTMLARSLSRFPPCVASRVASAASGRQCSRRVPPRASASTRPGCASNLSSTSSGNPTIAPWSPRVRGQLRR